MIRNLALHLAEQFRHNDNLRFSSSTLHNASPSPSSAEPVHISQNCVRVTYLAAFVTVTYCEHMQPRLQ
ncbi:hypothetical protein VNO78_07728 [Psophocarpus tetragonolobus]|uniref:Uncharacterized protein n=1 Tax=Psophocarpus tetragonolobus TaxID=3891 RepID=A0AAN9SVV1_PSOTE